MFRDRNLNYYLQVGANATMNIQEALAAAGINPAKDVTAVLDYACGYGRVFRWLGAAFPKARIMGVDADAKAAAAAAEVTGYETRKLDISLAQPLGETFDLIWVGSLFTHLPQRESERVLAYLRSHLRPGGIAVVTMHGQLVEKRLVQGERSYNLPPEGVKAAVAGVQATGYGFAPYGTTPGYGVSVARASVFMGLVEGAGLRPVFFKDAGWVRHQDVFAAVREDGV